MVYGVILESARDGIIHFHGVNIWKRIVHELKLPMETFDLCTLYSDCLLVNIAEGLAEVLREGTVDTSLEFFGRDFFRYFKKFGFDGLFRVAGKTFREFLNIIDQLHDSNRFTFPQMRQPLFHVTAEDHTGVTLEYKSVRYGYTHFAIGSILGLAKALFNDEDVRLYVRTDLSTKEYTHIVFWLQFDNRTYRTPHLHSYPFLPDLTGPTFLRVFPFSILMDCSLNIRHMGQNISKVFPEDVQLINRPLDEVFRLIRPDIHLEWDKILSYGRHIVFLMENRLPLRVGPSGQIRLKGQMKCFSNRNMLWFLCHPVLGSADDMVSAGLYLTDLNLFDNTSDLVIAGIHQTRQIEEYTQKCKQSTAQLQQIRTKLLHYRRRSRALLNTIIPRHVSSLMQSGVKVQNFCELYSLVTVMFVSIVDFQISTSQLEPLQTIALLDETVNTFDDITERFDVFKVKTKMNAAYMVVAGLRDRSNIVCGGLRLSKSLTKEIDDGDEEQEEEENQDDDDDKNSFGLNPTEIIAYLSFELLRASEHLVNPLTCKPFDIRIGFHAGGAVGGIVGDQKLQYCLFGDAVTTARQIMITGEKGRIHMSEGAYQHLVNGNRFTMEYRGRTNITDQTRNITYWLTNVNQKTCPKSINKSPKTVRCPFSGQ